MPVGHAPVRIASGLTNAVTAVERAAAVRANDDDSLYLVALQFTAAGEPAPQVGVWATDDLHTGWILAVDTAAVQFSDWGRTAASYPRINALDALVVVRQCLTAA